MTAVAITAWQCLSAAGEDRFALGKGLLTNRPCLAPIRLLPLPFPTMVGEYVAPLPPIPTELSAYDCRNARFALAALERGGFRGQVETVVEQYGPDRIGLVLGTSTSGIYDSERGYRFFLAHGRMPTDFDFIHRHAVHGTAEFLGKLLGVQGPVAAVSTACSSSAKALGIAQRLLVTGICDAVLVAGVDTLCRLTLFGFHSLGLVAEGLCRPLDSRRCGINIGEGAALLLLERATIDNRNLPRLLAVGESSDAHHMAAPDPEGYGAEMAMTAALHEAGLPIDAIDYVKLHATATPLNDFSEVRAVERLFGGHTPCSGLKGLLGHTLGASGAVEVVALLESMRRGWLPGTCGLETPDASCRLQLLHRPRQAKVRYALSNAFGFGGSNTSILLSRGGEEGEPVASPAHGIYALAWSVCSADAELAARFRIKTTNPDLKRIPNTIRRRTSVATRLALCAAFLACERAGVAPAALPAVFASTGGEMQTTDRLCIELAKPDGCISPTAFHNSVHNTAAGYWSIATGSRQPTTAIGAGDASVAMAWLEAWARLSTGADKVLLVCYEERWPAHVQPGMGLYPVALAWVLGREGQGPAISAPRRIYRSLPDPVAELAAATPILAALPLIEILEKPGYFPQQVPLGAGWAVTLEA